MASGFDSYGRIALIILRQATSCTKAPSFCDWLYIANMVLCWNMQSC